MKSAPSQDVVDFCLGGLKIPIVATHKNLMTRMEELLRGKGSGGYLVAVNPEKLCRVQKDSELLQAIKGSAGNYADGVGVVWALRWLQKRKVDRIPGIDLFGEVLKLLAEKQGSVFLFGAEEEISRICAETLPQEYPGIFVVGRKNGYQVDENTLIAEINRKQPDVVAVALGSPAQEKWMAENSEKLQAKVLMGVGGSFDVISGKVKRAPKFLRKCGLEWVCRLLQNPSRLRRHVQLLRFVRLVVVEKLRSFERPR